MKNTLYRLDVVVVGHGLSGVLAAIRAQARGLTVAVIGNPSDSAALESLFEIPPTDLNPYPISGKLFSELVAKKFQELGVTVGSMATEIVFIPQTRQVQVTVIEDAIYEADQLIYSPIGHEIGLASLPNAADFLGVGVSMDAWSDADFYKGHPVAVYGCGKRAAEQALIAALAGAIPTICCAQTHFNAGGLDQQLHQAGIAILERTEIRSLDAAPTRKLSQLSLIGADGEHVFRTVSALFLAQGLACDWGVFNLSAEQLARKSFLVAGLASGIPYWDYLAQVQDVDRVVDELFW